MKVLLLTHGTYLQPDNIVVGNSVRAYYLSKGLLDNGIDVVHVYPEVLGPPTHSKESILPRLSICTYRGKKNLAELIYQHNPDVLLIGYWELMEELPDDVTIPIVLDVVAPRILEVIYQSERSLDTEIQRMLNVYQRADRFITGNNKQRHFLLPWLILAGFDCRDNTPIDVIPISTEPGEAHSSPADKSIRCFVSGGVSWPWRRTENYFDALVLALGNLSGIRGKLSLFSGKYAYSGEDNSAHKKPHEDTWPDDIVQHNPLLPYRAMEDYLSRQCDIGVELADRNIEREYSQSFRSIEFLRCGLPVICNDYLELSEHIKKHDAGWVINNPDQLLELIPEIVRSPEIIRQKSKNAIQLINSDFHYRKTIQPLVDFISNPARAIRAKKVALTLPSDSSQTFSTSTHLTLPRKIKARVIRSIGSILKSKKRNSAKRNIVIVSRSDIFPPDHGAAVKIDRTAWGLSQHVDNVFLITDDRGHYHVYQKGQRQKKKFPVWLQILSPPVAWVRINLLRKGIPLSDAFLYRPLSDWSYILRTLYIGARHPVFIYQAEFPAYARACIWGKSVFGGKTLLVEHNVEYQRLKEQIPSLTEKSFNFLRNTEIMLCNQVDAVIAVSEADRDQLISDGADYRRLHVISHGVDLEQFDNSQPLDVRSQYNIPDETPLLVYHGIYRYPPNLEAMQIMADEILPRLSSLGITPKVLAIGRDAPATSPHENIIFTGAVESVAPYLLAADIAVVPLQQGGGTRMKILDYFAAGIPVVSTSKGAEGIPVRDNTHLVIEDDYNRFADAISRLLIDKDRAKSLSDNARQFVESLDWRNITQQYLKIF